ncbi:MAG TPA: hypothetical protein ENN09_02300, partial [Planctomycetes bacterium]|nr:hypothetical protein [Planctomycetota bacterium]
MSEPQKTSDTQKKTKRPPLHPQSLKSIIDELADGKPLRLLLDERRIRPLDFFRSLDASPDAQRAFDEARSVVHRMLTDKAFSIFDAAMNLAAPDADTDEPR